MAILYVSSSNVVPPTSPFPPSVENSDWFKNLMEFFEDNGVKYTSGSFLIFSSEAEMTAFFNQYTLTDPQLIEDIKQWNLTHNITFKDSFYDLPPLNYDFKLVP